MANIELYLVQPSPVQFIIEPQDLVFFHGDTISLNCETNCIQLQMNTTCAVGFLHNGLDLDYYEPPYENTLSSQREIGRRTLTIHSANRAVSGRYQCFTYSPRFGRLPLTDRIIGKPIHLQMAGIFKAICSLMAVDMYSCKISHVYVCHVAYAYLL